MPDKACSELDDGDTRPRMLQMARLISTSVVVVLGGSFHFGYQISLINPMADILQDFIQRSVNRTYQVDIDAAAQRIIWPSVAGLLFIGAFIGAIIAPRAMQKLGLKNFFIISSIVLLASFGCAFVSKVYDSAEVYVVGRFFSGVGIGMFTTTQAVYLTEISPVRYRGFIGTLTGFSKSIGFVLASGIGVPQLLGTPGLWNWAYLIEAIPSVIVLLGMLTVFYDSPVYLLNTGREKQAHKCLELYHGKAGASKRIPEIYAELEDHSKLHAKPGDILMNLFSYPPARKAFIICVLINVTVSFSGIMAVSFFGTFLLQGIGFSESGAAVANCLASFSGLLGNVVGTVTIERVGRRVLILGGLVSLAILNTALMFLVFVFRATGDVNTGYAFLAVFTVFLFVFSVGVGPLALFIATELTTSDYRPWMQSASISTQYLTCFISPLIFFPLYDAAGPLTFLIFIVPLLLCSGHLYFNLPETKNRPIEDIVRELAGN